ncbi:MAG: hypothetical protein KDD47_09300 [Acidobacteria bacterium]|nr:hypothetical protein [Acidobacteriota bacterium]
MAKFMFLHRGGCDDGPKPSPEQMQQAMQAWMEWMEGGLKAGWLLDPGAGLKGAGKVLQPDGAVTDGPFVESKELVGGYCLVEAADLDAAVELAKAMPQSGGRIEVRELISPPAE